MASIELSQYQLNYGTYVRITWLRRKRYVHFTQQFIFISLAVAEELNGQVPGTSNINLDI